MSYVIILKCISTNLSESQHDPTGESGISNRETKNDRDWSGWIAKLIQIADHQYYKERGREARHRWWKKIAVNTPILPNTMFRR